MADRGTSSHAEEASPKKARTRAQSKLELCNSVTLLDIIVLLAFQVTSVFCSARVLAEPPGLAFIQKREIALSRWSDREVPREVVR